MADRKRIEVLVRGLVQGVCFRAYMREEASRLGVSGWVRNRADGLVEAVVEGDKAAVEQLLKWCEKGSPYSRVNSVEIAEKSFTGEFGAFSIKL
ncbi:MAG: acylphosphatase [bacterium]